MEHGNVKLDQRIMKNDTVLIALAWFMKVSMQFNCNSIYLKAGPNTCMYYVDFKLKIMQYIVKIVAY